MNITFAPRGILQIDDAEIIFRNFEGREEKYNRKGDRNFALKINDPAVADELADRGWNVKIKPPRNEDDDPFMFLKVNVKFNDRGPRAYLQVGNRQVELDEESVKCLDNIDILSVDLDIRPYDWEVNGNTGRSAYLEAIRVYQRVDRFAAEEEY